MVENTRNKGLQEYTLGEKKGGNELFGSAYFFQLSPTALPDAHAQCRL